MCKHVSICTKFLCTKGLTLRCESYNGRGIWKIIVVVEIRDRATFVHYDNNQNFSELFTDLLCVVGTRMSSRRCYLSSGTVQKGLGQRARGAGPGQSRHDSRAEAAQEGGHDTSNKGGGQGGCRSVQGCEDTRGCMNSQGARGWGDCISWRKGGCTGGTRKMWGRAGGGPDLHNHPCMNSNSRVCKLFQQSHAESLYLHELRRSLRGESEALCVSRIQRSLRVWPPTAIAALLLAKLSPADNLDFVWKSVLCGCSLPVSEGGGSEHPLFTRYTTLHPSLPRPH